MIDIANQTNLDSLNELRARLSALELSARTQIEASNRMRDEFLAMLAHEIRSPLSTILGWTKVLRSKTVDEQTTKIALAAIQQSAEKQKYLIEDMLDVSSMLSGNLHLDIHPVSLSAVIRSAMEVMRPACEAKRIDCEIELSTNADAITGDAVRLERVIRNLISNAIKFTSGRGQVKIRLDRADPCVQITVSDTGKGINPEHLSNIFERYWQADDSGKYRVGGMGMSLSFVRHIIELHGGGVRAESDGEGKGAKFIITLPYRAVRLQNSDDASIGASVQLFGDRVCKDQHAPFRSSSLSGLRAVIVDDEPDARALIAAILRLHGADVTVVASAAEALQTIQEGAQTLDLLISDISMPEEDGYSLIRKVRALAPNNGGQIPAIALTSYGRTEDRLRVLSAGFQRHMPKPVVPAELALCAAFLTGRDVQSLNF